VPPVADLPLVTSIRAAHEAEQAEHDVNLESERLNLAPSGKRFEAWFMTPGIVNYDDLKDGGKELIKKETIDEALNTLIGRPLTIGHIPTSTPEDELLDYSNGTIDSAEFDAKPGWFHCSGTVETDQAREAIRKGHKISVGTRVVEFGAGGSWLNNVFDREIKKIRFHHLALVEPGQKPRFEEAAIRLNSTEKKPMNIVKLIKKIVAGDKTTEQSSDLPLNAKLDLGGGRTATVAEMLENERNNHCHAVDENDYIEHEGVRYHVGQLVKHFREHCSMGHHQLEAERAHEIAKEDATDTPEKKTAREAVFAAAAVVATAKTALDAADAEVARLNALADAKPEDKTAAGTKATEAKAAHEAAMKAGTEATDRFNAIKPVDPAVERANKAQAAAEAAATEAKAAQKKAEDALEVAKTERENAKKRAGAESFAILAGASERGVTTVFAPPSGGISNMIRKGRKLFGSDATPGKN
jgi:hypothetical protein